MSEMWLYAGALAAAFLIPGPDMLLLLQTGAAQGRAHALAAASGLAIARACHVALAALGLAALLHAFPVAFQFVRIIGACYLVWLAIGILRHPLPAVDAVGGMRERRSYLASARKGLFTNLLNPKALLFCSVLLPQFVHPENGSITLQFALLGAVMTIVGLLFDTIYAFTGSSLGNLFKRYPAIQSVQRWGFAALLFGFAARLAAV
ncbi:LysE family translocator [Brucella cytisi]|uniref:Lysine transporter LysE n=1 Tax=Brucella cytisi TaxID=407152 RepID=A0A1J6HE39_9HYPH|nr:LysE family translocator [Brucella cytisi]OIS91292.1 lysine transporter LysE [Brucella cytisi]